MIIIGVVNDSSNVVYAGIIGESGGDGVVKKHRETSRRSGL